MAFRRASGVRALGAPRARKLQPRTRAAASRPCLGPHCRTSPRTPRLATTRQPTLAPYSATARALLAARRRRPTASAPFSAAQATPARHLAPGTTRTHPQACPLAFVAATTPCKLQRGGSPVSSSTAAEPTSSRYKRTPRNLPSTQATLKPSPRTPWGSQSTRGGHLPHLRQQRPPPWPQLFQRHQGLSLPFLFTKNTSFLPGTQPPT